MVDGLKTYSTTNADDSEEMAYFPRLESKFEKRLLVGDGDNLLVYLQVPFVQTPHLKRSRETHVMLEPAACH